MLPGSHIDQTFDAAGQMLSTALKNSAGTVLDSYVYTNDVAGRRTSVQRTDNSLVSYGYDNVGQLISAVAVEADGSLRGNENFSYQYDPAGNLAVRVNNTLTQGFTVDQANGLLNMTRSNDLLTVAGSVSSRPTSLTVNGQSATIYGDLTYAVTAGLNIADGTNTLTAVVNGTLTNSVREVLPVSVDLRSDLNGNLLWDGLKAYEYDSANQLTRVTVTNAFQTEYAYDGLGRRRVRLESVWTGNSWAKTNEVRYVYNGMVVIQERNANNAPVVSYTRGLDLSGTQQGAGGIGGLLARTDTNGSAYYHADGSGNVTMLINVAGAVVAKYLYDSYGNTLGMWGTLAAGNTYRFSSKEVDLKTGLYYYGYRFYEPNLQRWLNRDPIGERGGINLYGFVGNNPISRVDPLGLFVSANPDDANHVAKAVTHAFSGPSMPFDLWRSIETGPLADMGFGEASSPLSQTMSP